MKALVTRPPWAFAIACLGKSPENRTWYTHYRGPLLIVAAKAAATLDTLASPTHRLVHDRILALDPMELDLPAYTARGAGIAVVELVDCHEAAGCCKPWGEDEFVAADHRRRRPVFHWVLEDARLIEPVPVKGRLGLFDVPDDLLVTA